MYNSVYIKNKNKTLSFGNCFQTGFLNIAICSLDWKQNVVNVKEKKNIDLTLSSALHCGLQYSKYWKRILQKIPNSARHTYYNLAWVQQSSSIQNILQVFGSEEMTDSLSLTHAHTELTDVTDGW